MNSVMFSIFHRILDISSVMTTLTFRKSWMVIRCSDSRSKLEKLAHFAHETLLVSAFRCKGLFRINLLLLRSQAGNTHSSNRRGKLWTLSIRRMITTASCTTHWTLFRDQGEEKQLYPWRRMRTKSGPTERYQRLTRFRLKGCTIVMVRLS